MEVINEGGNGMPPYEELLSAEEKSQRYRLPEDPLSFRKVDGLSGGTLQWIVLSRRQAGMPPK